MALSAKNQAIYDDAVSRGLSAGQLALLYGISAAEVKTIISGAGLEPLRTGETAKEIYDFAVENGVSAADVATSYNIPVEQVNTYTQDQGLEALPVASAPPPATTPSPATTPPPASRPALPEEGSDALTIYNAAIAGVYTSAEVAAQYGIPVDQVLKWVADNNLPSLGLALDAQTQLPSNVPGPTPDAFKQASEPQVDVSNVSQPADTSSIYTPQITPPPPPPTATPTPDSTLFSRARESASTFNDLTETAVAPTVTETAVAPTVTETAVAPTVTETAVAPTVTETAVAPTVTETAVAPTVTEQPTTTTSYPSELGQGTTYTGMSSSDQIRSTADDLAYFTSQKNPAMALSRQRGLNLAEERGMGSGSFAGRASEGAMLDYAAPFVEGAQQRASQERMTAQQFTASSDVSAKQRRLDELMQQKELALRANDNAAARQLEADIQAAKLEVSEAQQIRELASLEYRNTQNLSSSERQQAAELTVMQMLQKDRYTAEKTMQLRDVAYRQESERLQFLNSSLQQERQLAVQREDSEAARNLQREITNIQTRLQLTAQDRDIEFQTVQREMDRRLNLQLQEIDVDYKEWLHEATKGVEILLETNRAAAILLVSYQDQLGVIVANPDSTTAQKQAAIDALKDAVNSSLRVIGATNIDLRGDLPDLTIQGDNPSAGPETLDPL